MWEALCQLLFPDQCCECRGLYALWCESCRKRLPRYQGDIPVLPVQRFIVCTPYIGMVRQQILRMKYAGQHRLASVFGAMLASHIPKASRIVPIPTAAGRIRMRGYDHMLLCARVAARLSGGVLAPQLLRQRDTSSQARLSRTARRQNVANAFVWQGTINPQCRYVLIDDVCTTGATLAAAIRCMRQAGVQQIEVVVIARGEKPTQSVW